MKDSFFKDSTHFDDNIFNETITACELAAEIEVLLRNIFCAYVYRKDTKIGLQFENGQGFCVQVETK